MEKEREGTIKKDLRMQMENRERKRERESTDRESKGGRALTSKRAKRERVSENGKDGRGEGPDTRDGDARGRGKEAMRVGLREEERGPRAERRGRESDGKNQ